MVLEFFLKIGSSWGDGSFKHGDSTSKVLDVVVHIYNLSVVAAEIGGSLGFTD